jgi:putative ABC transport system permease protein
MGKRSSMSFWHVSRPVASTTCRTKKGRTILTAFAGSIGIIGIALILSISSGVNDVYFDNLQKIHHDRLPHHH